MANVLEMTRDEGVARLVMTRPPANAITLGVAERLGSAFEELAADPLTRAVVVAGLPGCFSAGVDLKEVPGYDTTQQRAMVSAINRFVRMIYGCPKPTVAAVTGHAIAGGMCIALACDERIGADADFRYGLTEAKAGVPFPANALALVRAELTVADARRLVLGSTLIGTEAAVDVGLLDSLVAVPEVVTAAERRARELAEIPPSAYARTKQALRGATLAAMDETIATSSDPLLSGWLGDDTAAAAGKLLEKNRC